MITRIEIDGFKSFNEFALDLESLTIIAGPNGSGKSNLFDALAHLSRLADKTLVEAFTSERGSYAELFSLLPDDSRSDTISYAVEMLLPERVTDEFSVDTEIQQRRLRYELKIRMEDSPQREFFIENERLAIIRKSDDSRFIRRYQEVGGTFPKLTRGRQTPYIEVEGDRIKLAQDGNQGRKREFSQEGAKRTVLSLQTTVEFPHAFAARSTLLNLRLLQLNPEELRQPSKFGSPGVMGHDGKHFASALDRLKKEKPEAMRYISDDLAAIIHNIAEVDIVEDPTREILEIRVTHMDGYPIPAHQLSDGTLRILALIAMGHDPRFSGVVMLEEPENGVHPGRVGDIVEILGSISDLAEGRQVLANTHSPVVVGKARKESLAMAYSLLRGEGGPRAVTEMRYVYPAGLEDTVAPVALGQLRDMLDASRHAESELPATA